ncbi:helix-turn-helix domain-containing protein [Methylophilaceae bacterium]|nr:helix-turn-helix domain-containing protein [Methylophilaceae bacterium]
MSRQLKVTYLDICQNSTRNIYQVAKDINRPYNRVYADVKRLQEIGLIKAWPSIQAGRKVSILSAT